MNTIAELTINRIVNRMIQVPAYPKTTIPVTDLPALSGGSVVVVVPRDGVQLSLFASKCRNLKKRLEVNPVKWG